MFNNTRALFFFLGWSSYNIQQCCCEINSVDWILMISFYQCWPRRKDMDLKSIEVQQCSFHFWVNRHHQLQFDEHQSYSEEVDVYGLSACFRMPSPGTGTLSTCSRKASTVSKSSFRATATGSRQRAMDGATSRRRRRVSSSTQWREKHPLQSYPCLFYLKTCSYFISPRLQSEILQVIRACSRKTFGLFE